MITKVACFVAGIAVFAGGCALERVKPWERDLLAKPQMQLVSDPIESFLDEHI